jgi:hypothetical protein
MDGSILKLGHVGIAIERKQYYRYLASGEQYFMVSKLIFKGTDPLNYLLNRYKLLVCYKWYGYLILCI